MLIHMLPTADGPTYLDDAASLAVNDHPEASVIAAQRHLEGELLAARERFRRSRAGQAAPALSTVETHALFQALQGHGTAGTALTAFALGEHLDRHAAAINGSRRIGRDEALASISLVSDLLEVGEIDTLGFSLGDPRF